ncbi:60S ribosomal protein L7-like 1 isoform X3 [Pipistrellus kuhlii]|uniref:60S ribosomal protein L7-like 1 isoform X3 n=1 Tax=Pipistrellus kuhlii TaxID=59472 RepID=UPI001E271C17|nr:60S ribosomal protein L7-like 1 isoform X3 [Pipistrellus kuhlii]
MRRGCSFGKMAEEEQRKKIPLVPENLLKKRKAYQALKATEAKRALLEKKEHRKGKDIQFKRLEWFLHDAWRQQRDKVRLRRLDGKPHGLEVPDEHSLAFVVRIQRFPNLKSVRELILKRGQAKVKNKIIPLTDNTVIEEHLEYLKAHRIGSMCLYFGIIQHLQRRSFSAVASETGGKGQGNMVVMSHVHRKSPVCFPRWPLLPPLKSAQAHAVEERGLCHISTPARAQGGVTQPRAD